MADIILPFRVSSLRTCYNRQEKKEEINRVGRKKGRKKDIRPPLVPYTRIFVSLTEENSEPEQFYWPDRP